MAARRRQTLGLSLLGARIVRENGDVSGFFHTCARNTASILSALPLGLGYWWALWDENKQTWHDKIMHTYVVHDAPELATSEGTSSTGAVVTFWAVLVLLVFLVLFALFSISP